MDQPHKIIEAFAGWFEGAGFQPQESYRDEAALTKDLRKQLDLWVRKSFAGWRAKARGVPRYFGPFNYRYRPDIELFRANEECIPIEVKLMKQGWEPAAAIGQAVMYSRVLDEPAAIAAVLDTRRKGQGFGHVERSLQKELWERLGVRLCVRKG